MNEPILTPEAAIAALAGEDNQIRYYAAWWLGKHQVQSACTALCEALTDDRYRLETGGYPLRRQAARALGQLKNLQAVPALIEALDSQEDLQLREAVIQALAAIGDKRAIRPLLDLLHSQQQPDEALIEALGTLQVWSARPQIEPCLQHPSERVQCAAARYMYLLACESQYIERIIKNLNHDNVYLRWAAIFDLGAIGQSQEAVQAIIAARVPNNLKLLNLKQILEAGLNGDTGNPTSPATAGLLFDAIDDLLIQL